MSNIINTKRNVAICTTTIYDIDKFIDEYMDNVLKYCRADHVQIFIAGDNKSPESCTDKAKEATRKGLRTKFLTIESQRDYLKRFPDLSAIIPENSDNRRNVAYLIALEEGAEVIISVDDDNFPLPDEDFVGEHLQVGNVLTLPEAIGYDGWFNLCCLLKPDERKTGKDKNLYPRGYPYKSRHPSSTLIGGSATGRIGVNVGLWRGDPDTDAIGRLYANPYIAHADGREVFLGNRVRCPINTQNTALTRDAMVCYYYVRMGEILRGMRLDRFGDIFSGYFLQICTEAVGDRIRIGSPIMDHRRNDHNLLMDLYNELAGIMILEDLSLFFSNIRLPGHSYAEAYRALSYKLQDFVSDQKGFIWSGETKNYFKKICHNMRIWVDSVVSL